jgi:hypothetical protein
MCLAVCDINAALALNKIEPVYGLSKPEHSQVLSSSGDGAATAATGNATKSASALNKKYVNLGEQQFWLHFGVCNLNSYGTYSQWSSARTHRLCRARLNLRLHCTGWQ